MNKLALGYNFMGEHSVKNIAELVRVYKIPIDPKYVGKKRCGNLEFLPMVCANSITGSLQKAIIS